MTNNNSSLFSKIDIHDSNNRSFVIGVDESMIGTECSGSIDNFLNCDLLSVQTALFFIQLIAPPNLPLKLKIYADGQFGQLMEDMKSGSVDVYPFELTVEPNTTLGRSYYVTSPVTSTNYYMYSSINAIRDTMKESPTKFLSAPFRLEVWAAMTASAVLCLLLFGPLFYSRRAGNYYYATRCFVLIRFSYAFLAVVYSSHLKALLTQPSASIPFHDLYDLARKIEQGTKKLIVEDKDSLRYQLLTEESAESDAFQNLYRVLTRNPQALIFEPNETKICNLLNNSVEYVYFAYDDLVLPFCGRLCLWKYRVTEYPETPVTFPLSSRTTAILTTDVDIYVHAVENFRRIQIRRRYGRGCTPDKPQMRLIGFGSFGGAFLIWGVGLACSTLAFLIQRSCCCRNRRLYAAHNFEWLWQLSIHIFRRRNFS